MRQRRRKKRPNENNTEKEEGKERAKENKKAETLRKEQRYHTKGKLRERTKGRVASLHT